MLIISTLLILTGIICMILSVFLTPDLLSIREGKMFKSVQFFFYFIIAFAFLSILTLILPEHKEVLCIFAVMVLAGHALFAKHTDDYLKFASVFIITTSNENSDRKEAYSLNMTVYIIKHINFDKFSSAISVFNNFWK